MKGQKGQLRLLLTPLLVLILGVLTLSGSTVDRSSATHAPGVMDAIVSGDTDIFNAGAGGLSTADCDTTGVFGGACSGNFYTDDEVAGNEWNPINATVAGMRQGPIDPCSVRTWTTAGVNNRAVVDIVIQDVTDLTGYQVRINYNENRVNSLGTLDIDGNSGANAGFLPFQDRYGIGSEFVSTVNLIPWDQTAGPPRSGGVPATNPKTEPGSGTILFGDTYVGLRSAAFSADVGPTGAPPNAPEGGLLVRTYWELEASSDGQLLYFDIVADTTAAPAGPGPNPGTKVLVFDLANPNGNIEQKLPETHLGDFRIASDGPAGSTPVCSGDIDECSSAIDTDVDGFLNSLECHVGTNPLQPCSATAGATDELFDALPTDFTDDRSVGVADLSQLLIQNGRNAIDFPTTYNGRFDIAPSLSGDNSIGVADLSRFLIDNGKNAVDHFGCPP